MNQECHDFLTMSWMHVLRNDEDIIDLFKVLDITHPKNIRILSRVHLDDNRLVIELVADNIDGTTSRVIIDATSGIPTWQQFINVTYYEGESADIRIILYGKDYRDCMKDLSAGGIIEIGNLVRRNNRCGVATYLVKGIELGSSGQKSLNECHPEERPNNVQVDERETFPSGRQVQEAEFWAGYYFPHWYTQHIGLDDDIITIWAPGYWMDHDLRTVASWNDSGFFIKLVEDKHSDALQWIWNNRKNEFEKAYPESDITFDKIDDERHAISVRILDVSMTDLIEMTPDHKWYYGQFVFDQEHIFEEVADGVVDDYDEMIKAANVT